MSRVLILTLIFPPDGVSSAQLLGEIAADLNVSGDEVRVITTSPHYNRDEQARDAQPIKWRWHRLIGASSFDGVSVEHIRMSAKSAGSVGRILQWTWFHLASFLMMVRRRKDFDSILTISPPPTVAVVAGLVSRMNGSRVVYCVWELYPEILVTLGKLRRGSILDRALRYVERLTYRLADQITVLHEPMRKAVITAWPPAEQKTTVVPTFADTDFLTPMDRLTRMRVDYQLGTGPVVGYAGNLGVSEDFGPILEAAALMPSVQFFVCGDGSDRQALEDRAAERSLDNVTFAGQLPYSRVPEIVATCDIGLVILSPGVGDEALPSKVYRTMACGRAILAVTEPHTPLALLVREHKIGLSASPQSPEEIAERLDHMLDDTLALDDMAERAREIAIDRFSRRAVTRRYAALLTDESGYPDGAK